MQRYFASIRNNFAYLSKEDEHHLLNVMRANKNEDIEIVFENKLYLGRINELKPLSIKVVEEIKSEVELPNKIILIICLLKGEKLDLVVQKATELGVSEIVFVASKRAISKAKDFNFSHKCERYNKIAKEAAQQSHRLSVPVINRLIDFNELGEIIADEKMIAYEKEDGKTENMINIVSNLSSGESLAVLIGPEGGFEKSEVDFAVSLKYKLVSLGKRILRAETAAIYSLSVISCLLEK